MPQKPLLGLPPDAELIEGLPPDAEFIDEPTPPRKPINFGLPTSQADFERMGVKSPTDFLPSPFQPKKPSIDIYGRHTETSPFFTMLKPDYPQFQQGRTPGVDEHLMPQIFGGVDESIDKLADYLSPKMPPHVGEPVGGIGIADLLKTGIGVVNNPLGLAALNLGGSVRQRGPGFTDTTGRVVEPLGLPPGPEPLGLPPRRWNLGNSPFAPTPEPNAPVGPFTGGQMGVAEPRLYNIDFGQTQIPNISFERRPGYHTTGEGVQLNRGATPNQEEVVQVPPEIAATYGTGLGRPTPVVGESQGYPPAPLGGQTPEFMTPPEKQEMPPNYGPRIEGLPEGAELINPEQFNEPAEMSRRGKNTRPQGFNPLRPDLGWSTDRNSLTKFATESIEATKNQRNRARALGINPEEDRFTGEGGLDALTEAIYNRRQELGLKPGEEPSSQFNEPAEMARGGPVDQFDSPRSFQYQLEQIPRMSVGRAQEHVDLYNRILDIVKERQPERTNTIKQVTLLRDTAMERVKGKIPSTWGVNAGIEITKPVLPPDLIQPGREDEDYNAQIEHLKEPTPGATEESIFRQTSKKLGMAQPLPPTKLPTEPAEMARKGEGTFVDMGKGTGKLIGRALYGSNPAGSAAKEIMQNALDATEHLVHGRNIKVDVDTLGSEYRPGESAPSIMISDNGPGLTREQLDKEFSDISASGKRGVEGMRGKYGAGKGAYLLGGDYAEVITITKEGNNIVRHIWKGDPDELLDKDNPPVPIRTIMPPGTPTGTSVKTYIPPGTGMSGASDYISNLMEHSRNTSGKISLTRNGMDRGTINLSGLGADQKPYFTAGDKNTQFEVFTPRRVDVGRRYNVSIHLLNNGTYQATDSVMLDKPSEVPSPLVVDVKTNIDPESQKYPWELSRERLRDDAKKVLVKEIEKRAGDEAKRKQDELQRIYESLPSFPPGKNGGYPIKVYDAGNGYDSEELNALMKHPVIQDLSNWMNVTASHILEHNPEWRKTIESLGISFKEGQNEFDPNGDYQLGVWIPNPGTKKATAFVNHFGIMARHTPDQAVTAISHTLIHELAHTKPMGLYEDPHGKTMIYAVADIYSKLGRKAIHGLEDALGRLITDPTNPEQYKSQVKELLQGYIDSRGRAKIENDPLSKQGTGATGRGPYVPRNPKPDRGGIGPEPPATTGPEQPPVEQQPNITRAPNDRPVQGNVLVDKPGAEEFLLAQMWKRMFGEDRWDDFRNFQESLKLDKPFQPKTPAEVESMNRMKAGWNAWRSLKVGGDVSYALRQLRPYVFRKYFWDAVGKIARAGVDPDKIAEVINTSIQSEPEYNIARRAGVFFPELGAPSTREEVNISEAPERWKATGWYYRPTNAMNNAMANYVRFHAFKEILGYSKMASEDAPEMMRRYAQFVNNTTGRGGGTLKFGPLGKIDLEGGPIKFLSYIFTSPRMWLSRISMFNMYMNPLTAGQWWVRADRAERIMALKNLLGLAGMATVSYGLTKLAAKTIGKNVSISTDITNADFMKPKIGNLRIDPWMGLQQPLVLAARFISGKFTPSTGGKPYTLGQKFGKQNRWDVEQRFMESKEHPGAQFLTELNRAMIGPLYHPSQLAFRSFGKDVNYTRLGGSVFDPTWKRILKTPFENKIVSQIVPYTLTNLYEIAQEHPGLLPILGPMGVAGEGEQYYSREKP